MTQTFWAFPRCHVLCWAGSTWPCDQGGRYRQAQGACIAAMGWAPGGTSVGTGGGEDSRGTGGVAAETPALSSSQWDVGHSQVYPERDR